MADTHTDSLYKTMRTHHGRQHARANGYRAQFFFRMEQATVLARLAPLNGTIVDIACGSGLMLQPLLNRQPVMGLDFNREACTDARRNGLFAMRGDAFQLPFAPGSVAQIVNCQFLNQQTAHHAEQFIQQLALALQPGGQAIILWRHGNSLVHRLAHRLFLRLDRRKDAPEFPQYMHLLADIKRYATAAGLHSRQQAVTLPLPYPKTVSPDSWLSRLLGASFMLVLVKPGPSSSPADEN